MTIKDVEEEDCSFGCNYGLTVLLYMIISKQMIEIAQNSDESCMMKFANQILDHPSLGIRSIGAIGAISWYSRHFRRLNYMPVMSSSLGLSQRSKDRLFGCVVIKSRKPV